MLIQEAYFEQCGQDPLTQHQHIHENCVEIIQICSGEGTFLFGGHVYPIAAGNIFLIDSGQVHCSAPKEFRSYIRNKVILDKTVFINLLSICGGSYHALRNQCFSLSPDCASRAAEAIRQIALSDGSTEESLYSAQQLLEIVRLCTCSKPTAAAPLSAMDVALQYIQQHLADALQLDQIAADLYMSKWYLCHLFKQTTGLTVMDYIRFTRIAKAKQLLTESALHISDVCTQCGFESFSNFSRTFRSVVGISPSQYRKRLPNNSAQPPIPKQN